MQNFNLDNIVKLGAGTIYTCLDNDAPEPPTTDTDRDPEVLYLWEYRNTIVISLSITNNNIKPVKITLNIIKPNTDTIPIVYDIEIPAGGTLVSIGGNHKIILEHEDAIDIQIKNAVDNDLVVSNTSVMNIYDFGHIPPIKVTLPFYGDIGLFTGGESNATFIDKIEFASDSITLDMSRASVNVFGKASGSNSIEGIIAGGYSTYNQIDSLLFSTFDVTSGWGTLYDGTGYFVGSSDAITCLFCGGYNYINTVQYNLFSSGGAGAYWSALSISGRQYLVSVNNLTYALWAGGFISGAGYSSVIEYSNFKSQGQAQNWGSLWRGTQYRGAGVSNDVMGLSVGDSYSYYTDVHKFLFESQSDSSNFGNLDNYVYENGSVGNSIKGLFGGDERFSNNMWEIYFDTEFTLNLWGYCSYFDGGSPTGCSGN